MSEIILPNQSQSNSPNPKPIYTRSGWVIPPPPPLAEQSVLSLADLQGWAAFFEKKYGVKPRSLSNYPYNCVGMVFSSRRALIDPEYVLRILKEDNYRKILRHDTVPGDVVVYYDKGEPAHVGLIIRVERVGTELFIEVVSKWGYYPEFIHPIAIVHPSLGTPDEFYTDRP